MARLAQGEATVNDLAAPFAISQPAISQHLKVLEDADLVIAEKRGRERWNHLNAMPIKQIHDRWIGPYARQAVGVLNELKESLER